VAHRPTVLMEQRRYIARSVDAPALLQRFLVSGVVALLLLRFYLELTGFPQVGGGGLHIAHLLWGGLLMLAAIVLLLAFLGRTLQSIAAVVGGIGFGLFIDELGKFITSDNDYFFRPAVALIYVVFVLLFLVFRLIERAHSHSDQGYIVNALLYTGDDILHGFEEHRRDSALQLLQQVSAPNPVVNGLRDALQNVQVVPDPSPGVLVRLARRIRAGYVYLAHAPWFSKAVVLVFAGYVVVSTLALAGAVLTGLNALLTRHGLPLDGDVGFSAVSDIMVVIAALEWGRSRLRGLIWFERAILASILLVQPFLFYSQQLPALAWLVLDLILLEAVRYMIRHEQVHPTDSTQPATQTRRAPA
jgi:hypothetical protein